LNVVGGIIMFGNLGLVKVLVGNNSPVFLLMHNKENGPLLVVRDKNSDDPQQLYIIMVILGKVIGFLLY